MSYTGEPDDTGYCRNCECLRHAGPDYIAMDDPAMFVCPDCGEPMDKPDTLSPSVREGLRMTEWQRGVMARNEWGPSPGGAAGELNCSRAMVDKLVAAGVLKRNEFIDDSGRLRMVVISQASIELAKENKKRFRRWLI